MAPQQQGGVYQYLMNVTPGRVRGRVSDIRDGTLLLDPDGISVNGRAYYPPGKQLVVLLLSAFVGIIIGIILLEYVLRDPKQIRVPWRDGVDEIVLEPHKNRACIVYRLPDKPNKPASLAFRLLPPLYENFVAAARYFVPNKVRTGKIGSPTPWAAVFVLLALAVLVIALLTFGSR